MFVQLRAFHCVNCNRCVARYERHSYLHNRCIGANNLPYYYWHVNLEFWHAAFIFYGVVTSFTRMIDEALIFYLVYIIVSCALMGIYLKKAVSVTRSMLTN